MLIRPFTTADVAPAAALLRRAAIDFILHESTPDGARDAALGPGHPGVFTVNASNRALPFYTALGFERTAPMQVAAVLYNPMRLAHAIGSAG